MEILPSLASLVLLIISSMKHLLFRFLSALFFPLTQIKDKSWMIFFKTSFRYDVTSSTWQIFFLCQWIYIYPLTMRRKKWLQHAKFRIHEHISSSTFVFYNRVQIISGWCSLNAHTLPLKLLWCWYMLHSLFVFRC